MTFLMNVWAIFVLINILRNSNHDSGNVGPEWFKLHWRGKPMYRYVTHS